MYYGVQGLFNKDSFHPYIQPADIWREDASTNMLVSARSEVNIRLPTRHGRWLGDADDDYYDDDEVAEPEPPSMARFTYNDVNRAKITLKCHTFAMLDGNMFFLLPMTSVRATGGINGFWI